MDEIVSEGHHRGLAGRGPPQGLDGTEDSMLFVKRRGGFFSGGFLDGKVCLTTAGRQGFPPSSALRGLDAPP